MTDESPGSGVDVPKLIAGGFAVISGAVALVGGLTGAIPRMLRNGGLAFAWSVGLALIAVGITLIASQLFVRSPRPAPSAPKPNESVDELKAREQLDRDKLSAWKELTRKPGLLSYYSKYPWRLGGRSILTTLGFLVFAIAAMALILGLTTSLEHNDQPRISTTWKIAANTQPIAAINVTLDGVKTDDTLFVTVQPGQKVNAANVDGVVENYTLYRAQTGANLEGVADTSFEVQVPQGYASLQIIASLNQPYTCTGEQKAVASVTSAGGTQTTIVPTPASAPSTASTAELLPVPQQNANFSCVVAVAPVNGAIPMPSTNAVPISTS